MPCVASFLRAAGWTPGPYTRRIALLLALGTSMTANAQDTTSHRRVPAEWEPQAAVWLQWPGRHERAFEPAFAQMAGIISRYQTLHVLVATPAVRRAAVRAIEAAGFDADHASIVWHDIPNDSAWMRDNGPVYVVEDGALRVQDWEFDAWGGAFGSHVPYEHDNRVPARVADVLGLPVEHVPIVHERGNLEFNGVDAVLLNWSTLGDPARNPGYTREQAERDLKRVFGVTRVVMVEGVPQGARTRGQVDGFARFISADTSAASSAPTPWWSPGAPSVRGAGPATAPTAASTTPRPAPSSAPGSRSSATPSWGRCATATPPSTRTTSTGWWATASSSPSVSATPRPTPRPRSASRATSRAGTCTSCKCSIPGSTAAACTATPTTSRRCRRPGPRRAVPRAGHPA